MEGKVNEVNRRLKEEEAPYSIEYTKINKNNVVLDAIRLCGHTNTQPVVYIDKEEFLSTDISEIVKSLNETFEAYSLGDIDTSKFCDKTFIFDHVYPRLVSKANLSWIKEEGYVYSKFLDMAVLYFVVISSEDSQMRSFLLNGKHIGGLDPDEIHRRSIVNLRKEVDVVPFSQMFMEWFGVESFQGPEMWIVTNKWRINGAACMLLTELLEDLSDMFGDDFILLPSSVHEFIAVPVGVARDLNDFLAMVREINESTVAPEDRLTNNVYIWDGALRPFVK